MRHLPAFDDPNLIVGAEHFSDAGVYRLTPDLAVVQSVDFFPPLVDDPFVFGQIAAANSMSDVYACGARPRTVLNIVCFPDNELDLAILEQILAGGAERVREAGAVVVGGHSVRDKEVKYGLAVTGTVHPEQIFTNDAARPGDVLYLTKPLGTGFVTTANKKDACPDALLEAACQSMITLNAAASGAAREAAASAVTDVTGFGLIGHALELAMASNVTVVLHLDRIPYFDGVLELVRAGFRNRAVKSNRAWAAPHTDFRCEPDDPVLELICDPQTSGGLLVSVPESHAAKFEAAARARSVPVVARIGHVQPYADKYVVIEK